MPEFVILADGGVPRLLAEHTERNPMAIVAADSEKEALRKYTKTHESFAPETLSVIPISSWGHTGTFIEPDGENEPICFICIEEDGGFTGEEVELAEEDEGPCWRCLYLLRESGIEYIE